MVDRKNQLSKGLGAVLHGSIPQKPEEEAKPVEDKGKGEAMETNNLTPVKKASKPKEGKKPTAPPNSSAAGASRFEQMYNNVRKIQWPIISLEEPYLIPGPPGFEEMNGTMNFRLPINLDKTVEAHCRAMGVNKSEWVREAMKLLLLKEQQFLNSEK